MLCHKKHTCCDNSVVALSLQYDCEFLQQCSLHAHNVGSYSGTISFTVVICGNWSEWSPCSKTCGFGERHRSMDCLIGDEKKTYNESKECYLNDCPAGNYSYFFKWFFVTKNNRNYVIKSNKFLQEVIYFRRKLCSMEK